MYLWSGVFVIMLKFFLYGLVQKNYISIDNKISGGGERYEKKNEKVIET